MPFIEQVRLLSLLPRSMSYENVMATFGCSRHAIKSARRMQADNESLLQSENCQPFDNVPILKKSNILLVGWLKAILLFQVELVSNPFLEKIIRDASCHTRHQLTIRMSIKN